MHPLLEKQNTLQQEAKRLLDEVLLPLLTQHGEVKIEGSYRYGLMSHPDIDIAVLKPEITKDDYVRLCSALIALPNVSRFGTVDRIQFPRTTPSNKPNGYWLRPLIVADELTWVIDIWFQQPDWHVDMTAPYIEKLAHLDDATRITILTLKEELRAQGLYGVHKEFRSVEVYDAVLENDAKTIEDIREYKKSLGTGK